MTAKEKLREKLLSILENLEIPLDNGTGIVGEIPEFDYYALDYLDFAELNLARNAEAITDRDRDNELISCVSNLKRAIDCQIECFLCLWGLRDEVRKRNLGLDKKLTFLADIGIMSSRTISRFTTLRNRIEHDFQRPIVSDLESLFDLVTAVVAILRMTSNFMRQIAFGFWDNESEDKESLFEITYDPQTLKFTASWRELGCQSEPVDDLTLEAPFSNLEDFAYFFRVLLLLNQLEGFASYEHIRARL